MKQKWAFLHFNVGGSKVGKVREVPTRFFELQGRSHHYLDSSILEARPSVQGKTGPQVPVSALSALSPGGATVLWKDS